MSGDFNKAAKLYLVYWDDTLVGMFSTLALPGGGYKYAFRVHRTVVLPDFQGLGIGTKLLDFFGDLHLKLGCKMYLKSTHVRFARHCRADRRWRETGTSGKAITKSVGSDSRKYKNRILNRPAYSFEYVGSDYYSKPHKVIVVDDSDPCPSREELLALKQEHYLIVVTGHPKAENECEKLCKELGIRTEQLYYTHNGVLQRKEKFTSSPAPRREQLSAPQVQQDVAPAESPAQALLHKRSLDSHKSAMPLREKPRRLFIDLETYSSTDIKAGVFKYVEAPDFEILLIAYAWDDQPVQLLDLTMLKTSPESFDFAQLLEVEMALTNPEIVKVAHNSAFERAALAKYLAEYLPPEQWEDTMILAAYNGLPLSLEAAGSALGLPLQKIKEGTLLINYFCRPCKQTKTNGNRTRNLPEHALDKWERFCSYCLRDVEVCQEIYYKLSRYPVTDFERRIWALDARINEHGVKVDIELAEAAVAVDEAYSAELLQEMQRLTQLENPNSVAQLKEWLSCRGLYTDSLDKAAVQDLLSQAVDPTTKRVLQLRQLLSKTSTKKYTAMLSAACADDRVRGLTQYYGASRTGRWAGRLVQLQNLPQNHLEAIGEVRELVRSRDLDTLELIFSNVSDVLSQLIRTALVAKDDHTFLVADFSAIEARVIAYLAGEQWRMDVFAQGGDIYCSSASQMFKVPVEKHGINGHLRQKGKIAELACGYGGGVNALVAFGADKMGLTEPEMQEIVTQWREASPTIPRFWREAEQAAKQALAHPGKVVKMRCGVMYRRDADALKCQLPSGRQLTYWDARLEDGSIVFMGQAGQSGIWAKVETWGGKLVENIVQAYARDCLAVAMDRLAAAGFDICFHVHDEVVAEAPKGTDWREMAEIMGRPIDWAPGLLLRADGYTTDFYMKD